AAKATGAAVASAKAATMRLSFIFEFSEKPGGAVDKLTPASSPKNSDNGPNACLKRECSGGT
ncbi:MAG: hypothetical protein QE509_14205, partial [Gammaproteobacteria bacterium]|nr:hypothetical protein [Gammaproteobacteria bacterium]